MTRFLLVILAFLSADATAAEPSLATTDDLAKVVQGNNAFSIELYGRLTSQPGNLFFSPESISTAMAMAYAGARGDTAVDMAKTMHFTLPPERLHPTMGALLADLNATHDGYQLKMANALWVPKDFPLLDEFQRVLHDTYGDAVHQIGGKLTAEVNEAINSWAEQETANRITDLMPREPKRLIIWPVLTNVAYFKGDWERQFDRTLTQDEDFHMSSAHTTRSPLMHDAGDFDYFNGGTFQALTIPYKGKELSMIVFLPNAVDGLSTLEQALTEASVEKWLSQLRPASGIILTLPRFRLTQQLDLSGVGLPLSGMNLSGMTGNNLTLTPRLLHQADIDINEEGTEVGASSGIEEHFPSPYRPPITFRADHPFIFIIRDNRSKSILFMGRVSDPSKR